MAHSLSRAAALMFLLVLAFPATVLAQTKDTADVQGLVLDASGRPAAGYPMKMMTSQGEVIISPTEDNGAFGVDGLPPGNYEFRVFEPGTDHPIASKKVTLAAGQKEQIDIRLGSDNPAGGADGRPATGTTPTTGVNWTAVAIPVLVLAAGIVAFFALRRRPGA